MSDPNQLWERTFTPFPNFLPQTTGATDSGLSPLKSITDYLKPTLPFIHPYDPSVSSPSVDPMTLDHSTIPGALDFLSGGYFSRVVTVIVGLIFITAGLYLFGTSSVADALRRNIAAT